MSNGKVSVVLITLDKTRRASITLPRSMYVSDIIKASTKRWFLSFRADYQVCNTSTNRVLLPSDSLSVHNVKDGDILMLQPFAAHGGRKLPLLRLQAADKSCGGKMPVGTRSSR